MVTVRNSQILNYTVVNHGRDRHPVTPFELLWCYRAGAVRQVGWRFFRTDRAARAFASDLVNAVVNSDGSPKADTGTTAATVAAEASA